MMSLYFSGSRKSEEIVTKYFRNISVNNTVASINAAVLFFFYDKDGISAVG